MVESVNRVAGAELARAERPKSSVNWKARIGCFLFLAFSLLFCAKIYVELLVTRQHGPPYQLAKEIYYAQDYYKANSTKKSFGRLDEIGIKNPRLYHRIELDAGVDLREKWRYTLTPETNFFDLLMLRVFKKKLHVFVVEGPSPTGQADVSILRDIPSQSE